MSEVLPVHQLAMEELPATVHREHEYANAARELQGEEFSDMAEGEEGEWTPEMLGLLEKFPMFPASRGSVQLSELGEGSYGIVFQGTWNGVSYAFKKLLQGESPEEEATFMARVGGVLTVKFVGLYQDGPGDMYLVMERLLMDVYKLVQEIYTMPDKGLRDVNPAVLRLLRRENNMHQHPKLRRSSVLRMCRTLYLALKHLHRAGLAHNDLKQTNIFLVMHHKYDEEKQKDVFWFDIKVGDLGGAFRYRRGLGNLDPEKDPRFSSHRHPFIAPEVGRKDQDGNIILPHPSADWYSYALNIMVLLPCDWRMSKLFFQALEPERFDHLNVREYVSVDEYGEDVVTTLEEILRAEPSDREGLAAKLYNLLGDMLRIEEARDAKEAVDTVE
eukprot:CAMPEP_0119130214 /NCGR_PEP_ID=MMETSP1310-20130426/7639_1 /TAXON_ID=464262 /ORGANISM="Genus nov. species nov., Strain RCC2339" /LENGTH=386 /DNA_ID=CAMNT_0007120699 /DNA_START=186 /DNA_END=1346 /DNA_ORIENTATION=+